MRRILLALILAVSVCGLASAAVNNIQVSGDVTTQAISRDLSLGKTGSASCYQDSEDFLLSQVRLRIDADLTENVAAVVQILNERIWGQEDEGTYDGTTDMDIDLAYLEMKEMFYAPVTAIIGRQNLRYGRGLIVGDPDTDNEVVSASGLDTIADDLSLRKSFDAIRVILDYSPVVIDLVYAKVQENATNVEDDVNLLGINAAMEINDKTNAEVYLFTKKADNATSGTNSSDSDSVMALGTRLETTMVDSMLLYGEFAYQFGRDHSSAPALSRKAFAGQVGAMFMFGDEADSKIGLEYTYLSGDNNSSDNDQEAWDPMFEDQRVGEIANLLFDNTNMWYIKATGSTMLKEDLKAQLDGYYLELAEKVSTFPNPSSVICTSTGHYGIDSNKKEIGYEVDASLLYDYTEDVQMGLIGGVFFPGDLFDSTNDNTAYSVRATASVQF